MLHTAIYDPQLKIDTQLKAFLQHQTYRAMLAPFNKSQVALFSPVRLTQFIEEEARHDHYKLKHQQRRNMRHCSSGEQRKALYEHLFSLEPEVIILDNPFDTLDSETQCKFRKQIEDLSQKIIVIQILKRKEDLLNCICEMIINIDGQFQKLPIAQGMAILETEKPSIFSQAVPPISEPHIEKFETLVRFCNVDVAYEDRSVLNNINWIVKPGEFWQVIGPNGSGKSTILTMINGDNPKAFGQEIYLFDKKKGSGETVWDIKKRIGYFTPSMMDLFKNRSTALEMIASGLTDSIGLYQSVSKRMINLATEWLQLIHIEKKADIPFIELSQKEQRLILIARAMIKHPHLLILDEPNIGLDDNSAFIINCLIQKMSEESDTAILYVSHRKENGIDPDYILQLKSSKKGSQAVIS